MTPQELEKMLGRYVNGTMKGAEEEEFFIRVALDRDLRNNLKAQRIVQDALSKDRNAEPVQHTAMRSRVAGILAASSARAPQPQQKSNAVDQIVAGNRSSAVRWIATLAIALLISTAIYFSVADRSEPAPPSIIEHPLDQHGTEAKGTLENSTNNPLGRTQGTDVRDLSGRQRAETLESRSRKQKSENQSAPDGSNLNSNNMFGETVNRSEHIGPDSAAGNAIQEIRKSGTFDSTDMKIRLNINWKK